MTGEVSLQRFLRNLKQKTFLIKLNMISCILLVLLLLVSMVLLKCKNSPLVIHFLNFVRLASSIGTFDYDLVRFLCDVLSPLVLNIYSCKNTFLLFKNANLSKEILVSYDVSSFFTNISLQEIIEIVMNLSKSHFQS